MNAELATSGYSPVRVTQHESRAGRWETASRRPHPNLRQHVIGYVGLKSAMRATRERHLPSGEAALVINLGPPHRVVDWSDRTRDLRFCDVAVMGLHDRPFFTESDGSKHLAVVRLTPPSAYVLFGVPMEELLNRWIGLDLIDKGLSELITVRARAAMSWDELFSFLDDALAERLNAAPDSATGARWAWNRLRASSGQASIRSVLHELDLSHKLLLAQFRQHVGLLPKATNQIVRFNRVLRTARGHQREANWAAIAQDCGYHDQAHLIREFKTFAHGTPGEIRSMVAGFTLSDPA